MLVQERLSVRQACKLVSLPRSVLLYTKKTKDDSSLIEALHELVAKHPTIGFWKCYYRLRRKGYTCNHKRLYRVYTLLRLNVRRRAKRRLPQRIKEPLIVPAAVNQGWNDMGFPLKEQSLACAKRLYISRDYPLNQPVR